MFYNLLRSQLVRKHPVPLSSDAFTAFGAHNYQEHNQEVRDATHALHTTCLATAAKELEDAALSAESPFVTDTAFSTLIHSTCTSS